jgi:hypothetical protein
MRVLPGTIAQMGQRTAHNFHAHQAPSAIELALHQWNHVKRALLVSFATRPGLRHPPGGVIAAITAWGGQNIRHQMQAMLSAAHASHCLCAMVEMFVLLARIAQSVPVSQSRVAPEHFHSGAGCFRQCNVRCVRLVCFVMTTV